MQSGFHPGELEMQRRAGVAEEAQAVGRIIADRLPAGAARFLSQQRLAVASSLDAAGRVWASVLTGAPGFVSALDASRLRLAVTPLPGDPLASNLAARPELGLLVIDPRTRQRFRINGRGQVLPEGFGLMIEQAYGNCPKYIQRRCAQPDGPTTAAPAAVTEQLDLRQQAWIAGADTLFIASFHPQGGADASHRGGFPGFVRVLQPDRLSFDDYPGNAMFNTLGNLAGYPRAGLLLVDFSSGDVLQLTGRTEVSGNFAVVLSIDAVREHSAAIPLRYRLAEYSPANPPLSQHAGESISPAEPDAPAGGGTR